MYTVFTHTCTFHYHTQLPHDSCHMTMESEHIANILEDCPISCGSGWAPSTAKVLCIRVMVRPFPSTMRTLQLYSNVEAFPQQT